MIIHCFGDSWVQGIGTEWKPGDGRIPMEERYREGDIWQNTYSEYSWPGQLRKLIKDNIEVKNYGSAGYSNQDIYKSIMETLWRGDVKEGDFVIVSLSSIVRQALPFLVTRDDVEGFINYSNSCFVTYKSGKQDDKLHWIESIHDETLKKATDSVYMDYIVNRFDYKILYEISMHFICNLQIYFEKLGIDYLFVNAFENNISKDVSFYNQIKQDKWILFDYTLQEYLLDKAKTFDTSGGYSVWEDDTIEVEKNQDGPHPNRIGYGMIAELIYEQIKDKNFIKNANII
jgi:hypothetical protein